MTQKLQEQARAGISAGACSQLSVKVKKKILGDLITALGKDPGLNPDDVMVCFKETQWENWSFGGGRLIHT